MRRVAGHAIEGTPCHFWVAGNQGLVACAASVHAVHVSLETDGAIAEYLAVDLYGCREALYQ